MRFIRELSTETQSMLERIYKQSRHHHVRRRTQCIILSFRGKTIKELMTIFQVSRKTVHNWLTLWEDEKLVGLYDKAGRGRKSKLTEVQKQQVKEWVKSEPKNLKKVLIKIKEEWEVIVSKETVKRILKNLGMRWKRMKRGLSGKPDDWEYEVKIEKLEELKELERKGEIDLKYLDESGFCLTPDIPYGWQEKEPIVIKSSHSKRINTLGVINRNNQLIYEVYSGQLNSKLLILFLDKLCEKLTKKTVVVMDQSSIHTSNAVIDKLEEWSQKNLEIFWLPTYSPKLNLIEILWRFMKYEWIEVDAYSSLESLAEYVENVLNKVGTEYVINFV